MSDDNVRSYRRKKLEPEVAAVSFQTADETPVIVINVDERRTAALAALKKLRPYVLIPLIPALITAAAERLIRVMREHSKTAMVVGATATAASAIAISPISIKWDIDDQLSKPPAAIRVVTQPAVTHTITVPPAPTRSTPRRTVAPEQPTPPVETGQMLSPPAATSAPPSPATRPSRPPTASSRPSSRPSARATSRPTTRPTSRPSTAPRVEEEPDPRPSSTQTSRNQPEPETSPRQAPQPTQEPTSAPSTAPPETTTGSGNCAIRVDLDPLLDLCVLG